MADLGNLWFSLGLDDSKFDKEWKAALNKYKNDAKIDVLINVSKDQIKSVNDITAALSKVSGLTGKKKAKIDIEVTPRTIEAIKTLRDLNISKAQLQAIKNAARATEEYARHLERAKNISNSGHKTIVKNFNKQALWLQNLRSLAANYLSLYAIKNFAVELANVTGEFEKQKKTLQAMVGEMEGLDIYNKMKALSVESPFEFKDLASYAKQLAAFSVPYEELYDTTKRLADVSAGLGVDMSRIILAYGQIKSAGVLRGTELRQLTEAGVPILEKLQKKFEQLEGTSVSVGEIFEKISKKMVSFEMVKDVFTELTDEGGKFYRMQEIQSETLAGKISNLKDAYAIMLTEIGEGENNALTGGVDFLYTLMDNWEKVGLAIKSVALAFGIYQAAQAAAFASSKLRLIGSFTAAMIRFSGSINKAVRAMTLLNGVTKAGVWGALLGILSGVALALGGAYLAAKRFNNELQDMISEQRLDFQNEVEALRNLTKAIEQTTEGTESRKRAIDDYNKRFGQYLKNLYDEKTALADIVKGNDDVRKAMSVRYKEEAVLRAKQAVEEKYGKKKNETEAEFVKLLREKGLGTYSGSAIAIIKEVLESNNKATMGDIQRAFNEVFKDKIVANNIGYRFQDFFDKYKESFLKYTEEMKKGLQDVDNAFNTSIYDSYKVEKEYNRITREYQDDLKKARDTNKPGTQGLQDAERKAEEVYLNKLIVLYAHNAEKVKEYEERLKKLGNTLKTWRDDVKELFQGKNIAEIYAPKESETFSEYIERIREDYKKAKKTLKDLNKEDFSKEAPALKARVEMYDELAKRWGIVLDEKGDNAAAQKKLKEEREAVAKLKAEYNRYLDVYKAYLNLKKKVDSDSLAVEGLSVEFKDYADWLKGGLQRVGGVETIFTEMFVRIAKDAKDKGGETGQQFVEAMETALGGMKIKEAVNTLGLIDEIKKELSRWGVGDFLLTGEGVTLEVEKALKAQTEADNQAYVKKKELLDKITQAEKGNAAEVAIAKKKYGEDWANQATKEIDRLYKLELENNKKIAEAKIKDLAKAYFDQAIDKEFGEGFLNNLGEKSMSQLKDISAKLKEMFSQPAMLMDEDVLELIALDLIDQNVIDEFVKKWEYFISLTQTDVDFASFKKMKKDLLDSGKAALTVVDALKGLQNNKAWSATLETLGLSLDTAVNVAGAWEKTVQKNAEGEVISESLSFNWASMASAAAGLVSNIIASIAASKEYDRQMALAKENFSRGIQEMYHETLIAGEKFDTIFGENLIGALKADNEAILSTSRELKNASKSIANMKIQTKKGFFGIGAQHTTLSDLAPQLFKPDGTVNGKYLDEFLDAYGDKISDSQKALLEHLKTTYEQYEDAIGEVNDYLSGIFSDTASTIADRMMEAFAATGNAATELGDLVNGVANQMAKDLVQSLLVDQYLAPAMERVKSLYDVNNEAYEEDPVVRTQKSILALRDGLEAAEGGAAEINKILQGLADYGIDFAADADKSSEVLSGLTEAQQNLLMGYINGIRADVSYNKGMMTNIVNSVGTISNNVADAIIVWKQIEANTHRSADGVDRIIGFFESVMGPYDGGGGQAIQVNIA